MSTQVNQYFMYGIVVPYRKCKEKIKEFNPDDDIHGIFSGRDGKFIILGKVLSYTDEEYPLIGDEFPYEVPQLEEIDERIVESLVKQKYGVDGIFHYYFITNSK
jgi:hypothetical protein